MLEKKEGDSFSSFSLLRELISSCMSFALSSKPCFKRACCSCSLLFMTVLNSAAAFFLSSSIFFSSCFMFSWKVRSWSISCFSAIFLCSSEARLSLSMASILARFSCSFR
uniref:Uncharacterized protein n=1 Tax=Anguilla anguilla TaxID=7936 RepID=A0A0E9XVC5_ANGAN